MKVAVLGTGYVGLVTATCLADFGLEVAGIDVDREKVETLRRGELPIYEAGLLEMVRRNTSAGRLRFATDMDEILGAEVVFLAVGTPSTPGGGADLNYIFSAARAVAERAEPGKVVVIKSTVPVGTGAAVEEFIRTHGGEKAAGVHVVSNPEFLREGAAVKDCLQPERIILGLEEPSLLPILKRLYQPLLEQHVPLLVTNRPTAELIKYASNAFLAAKISFINDMARLCDAVGADVEDVARGMGMDSRIGPRFLKAGPGFGGSCFPKDTRAQLEMGQRLEIPCPVVEGAVKANAVQREFAVELIRRHLHPLRGKILAFLGMAFKAETDDMRESPALDVARACLDAGARVRAHDPEALGNALAQEPRLEEARDPYDAAEGAHAVVVATEWNQYKRLDFARMAGVMERRLWIDLRNLHDGEELRSLGFTYQGLGRQE